MKKHFLFVVFLFFCLCIKTFVIAQNNKSYPIADGTFIQNDLIASWSDDRWQLELKALKDVGMHYIIIAPTLHTEKGINESMYETKI